MQLSSIDDEMITIHSLSLTTYRKVIVNSNISTRLKLKVQNISMDFLCKHVIVLLALTDVTDQKLI